MGFNTKAVEIFSMIWGYPKGNPQLKERVKPRLLKPRTRSEMEVIEVLVLAEISDFSDRIRQRLEVMSDFWNRGFDLWNLGFYEEKKTPIRSCRPHSQQILLVHNETWWSVAEVKRHDISPDPRLETKRNEWGKGSSIPKLTILMGMNPYKSSIQGWCMTVLS